VMKNLLFQVLLNRKVARIMVSGPSPDAKEAVELDLNFEPYPWSKTA
jgi:hypothetical protein